MKKPAPLKPGDKVGIFVPSSPVREPYRKYGLQRLKEIGYDPVEVPGIMGKTGLDFLAKKPGDTFNDLQWLCEAEDIKAIWAARGGYGSNLLLPLLDGLKMGEPHIVIGSSDVSYLLWYIMDRFQTVVFYGPMAYSSIAENRFNAANLVGVLSNDYTELAIPCKTLVPGRVKAVVTGGCLSNLVSLIGTPYLPQLSGRILLLEDTGERPCRLDRMLWQLAHAGIFSNIKGLILGQYPQCFKNKNEKDVFLERVKYYLNNPGVPVVVDAPLGHSDNIHTFPLGIEIEIEAEEGRGSLESGRIRIPSW